MAQLVKCLGYMHEELWLITRLHVEKRVCFVLRSRMNVLVIPVLGRWRQRDPGAQWPGSLEDASQSRERETEEQHAEMTAAFREGFGMRR